MKRLKVISLILVASMMFTMTGCSSKGKKSSRDKSDSEKTEDKVSGEEDEVTEVVESFADALIKGDFDEVESLMVDGDLVKSNVVRYVDRYDFNAEMNEVYGYVIDTISYEIDESSVKAQKDSASLEITYTMVDYREAARALSGEDELADLLTKLKDEDDTIEITQEVELVPDSDGWKITYDSKKSVLELYSFYSEIFDLNLFVLPSLTNDEFGQALESSIGIDKKGWTTQNFDKYDITSASTQECSYIFRIYTSKNQAVKEFEAEYNDYVKAVDGGTFTGEIYYNYDGVSGYMVFDGLMNQSYGTHEYYGGLYLVENSFLMISARDPSDVAEDEIDAVLEEIGYPKPWTTVQVE